MSDADVIEVVGKLRQFGFSEVSHRTCFVCVRETKIGGDQLLRLEIDDAGPTAVAGLRYSCIATDTKTGKQASGNSGETIEKVLAMVHWWDLDE
jgi:hypothetical protein